MPNEKNKERMKKTEIAKILEWHNSGTLKTDEAVERICSLFSVVRQSEQLVCDDCGYEINPAGICINMNCSTNENP